MIFNSFHFLSLCIFVTMKILKIFAIMLLLVLTIPEAASIISPFIDVDCELVCCEKPTEEEQKENKSEKDFDDLEEFLLSNNHQLTEVQHSICFYTFDRKCFSDITTDIVTPPPKIG